MRELVIFLVLFSLMIVGLGSLIHLIGGSYGLNLKTSWALALVALGLFFPGMYNLVISINPKGSEDLRERCFAMLRGIGMNLMAAACVLPVISDIRAIRPLAWLAGVGLLLNVLATLVEFFLDVSRRKK